MKNLLTSASVLALATLPHAASAQDVFDLGTITISASQTPTETARTGASVEVVTQEDLNAAPAARIVETLDYLPGVSVSGNGGLGASATLRLRGLSNTYIGVYVDGIDVSDPSRTQTQFDFGSLTSGGIGRVEVLKGSQSAIYGSEAIAGVVNIQTRGASEIGSEYFVDVEVGSYGTRSATLGAATKSERGELALTFTQTDTNGFSAQDENDGNTEADGFSGTTLAVKGSTVATDTVTLGFALNFADSVTNQDGYDVTTNTYSDTDDSIESSRRAGRVYAEIDGTAVDHTVGLSFSDTERHYPLGYTSDFNGERTELSNTSVTQLGGVQLAFGGSYSEETFDADTATGTYEITSFFSEAKLAPTAALDLSVALRRDDHSVFGGFTTGRFAASLQMDDATTLRASLGTGFRAPSLYELFAPSYGNTALTPEESQSAEIGVERRFDNGGSVEATVFTTEIDNLIGFDMTTFAYAQTPGQSQSRGVEVAAATPLTSGIEAFGSYTYVDAVDADDAQLVRVPTHDLVMGVSASLGANMNGQLVANHIAGRANDGGNVMADYTVLNAVVQYDFNDSTQGYVRFENLTDEEYQTSNGYGTSDRAVYFGLRAAF